MRATANIPDSVKFADVAPGSFRRHGRSETARNQLVPKWTRARKGSGALGRRSDDNGQSSHGDTLESLIRGVAAGDRSAFEEVYRRTAPKLFAVCLRIIPRREEAEEALQDAYFTIWRRAARFDPARGAAMAWLVVLTRNAAIDRLRTHAHGGPTMPASHAPDRADPAPLAFDTLSADEDARRLNAGLDGLDAMDAGFLREAFLGGATYADLARDADLPLGTVKSRIRRALLRLREKLR